MLTEMFPHEAKTEYVLCFRPTGINADSPNRYVCRYLRIGTADARTAILTKRLTDRLADQLDRELPTLRQQAQGA